MIPESEVSTREFFAVLASAFGFEITSSQGPFPDYILNGHIRAEAEYTSSNFISHKHDHEKCDLVICWKHNKKLPIPVLELSTSVLTMPEEWWHGCRSTVASIVKLFIGDRRKRDIGKHLGLLRIECFKNLDQAVWSELIDREMFNAIEEFKDYHRVDETFSPRDLIKGHCSARATVLHYRLRKQLKLMRQLKNHFEGLL